VWGVTSLSWEAGGVSVHVGREKNAAITRRNAGAVSDVVELCRGVRAVAVSVAVEEGLV
jgi:hypothetical protein